MKITLNFSLKEDVSFKDKNDFFHKIFSTVLHPVNFGYSYKIPKYKMLFKDRIYSVSVISENEEILNKLKNMKHPKIEIHKSEIDFINFNNMLPIQVTSLSYTINTVLASKYNLDMLRDGVEKKSVNFSTKFHTIDLLKNLIIEDVNRKFKKLLNKEVYDFIEDIEITNSYYFEVKGFKVPVNDVNLKIKAGRENIQIANFILNNGLGAKASYGCGYVEQGM